MATDLPSTDAERGRRRRLFAVTAGMMILVVMMCICLYPKPGPVLPPIPGSPKVIASDTTVVTMESTPIPTAIVKPVSDAPALLASNAFTTLDDYRRRRAMAPQTPPPSTTPPAGRTPETELGRVTFLVRDYRAAFGSNPVGSNKEITRALLGGNARGTRFLDAGSVSLDAKGELLDAWGHPYFFHAMSGTMMEIRSAGPDGRLFTDDDLVK